MPRNKPNGKKRLTDKQMKIARVAEPRNRITAAERNSMGQTVFVRRAICQYNNTC